MYILPLKGMSINNEELPSESPILIQESLGHQCTQIGILTIITFFVLLWAIYNGLLRPINPVSPHIMNSSVIPIPQSLTWLFPRMWKGKVLHTSYEESLDGWSIGHLVTYFVLGMFYPGKYGTVLGLSILCEMYEFVFGYKARLSDLYVNLTGYWLASRYYKAKPNSWVSRIRQALCQNKQYCYYTFTLLLLLLCVVAYVRQDGWV